MHKEDVHSNPRGDLVKVAIKTDLWSIPEAQISLKSVNITCNFQEWRPLNKNILCTYCKIS